MVYLQKKESSLMEVKDGMPDWYRDWQYSNAKLTDIETNKFDNLVPEKKTAWLDEKKKWIDIRAERMAQRMNRIENMYTKYLENISIAYKTYVRVCRYLKKERVTYSENHKYKITITCRPYNKGVGDGPH